MITYITPYIKKRKVYNIYVVRSEIKYTHKVKWTKNRKADLGNS